MKGFFIVINGLSYRSCVKRPPVLYFPYPREGVYG